MCLCIFIIFLFHRILVIHFSLVWVFESIYFCRSTGIFSLQKARTLLHYAFLLAHGKMSTHTHTHIYFIFSVSIHYDCTHSLLSIQCNSTYSAGCCSLRTFLLLFRLWAGDCQCGMNEIRHGHIYDLSIPSEMFIKRKTMKKHHFYFFAAPADFFTLCLFRPFMRISLFSILYGVVHFVYFVSVF